MMDIEQLKLILEMVGGATDSAVMIAIIFAVLPFVKTIIMFLGWWLMLPTIANAVRTFVKSFD